MAHRLRRGALALVFTGIGFAVLYRRRGTSPQPANDGWVDLLPDLVRSTPPRPGGTRGVLPAERVFRRADEGSERRAVRARRPSVA